MCTGTVPCNRDTLTFETMLTDPLIRLVMQSDGVSVQEVRAMLTRISQSRCLASPDARQLSAA